MEAAVLGLSGRWQEPIFDWLDRRCRSEALRIQRLYQLQPQEFQGLVVSDGQVDALIGRSQSLEGPFELPLPQDLAPTPFGKVASAFDLSLSQTTALVVVSAPEFELRYSAVYAYLNNEASKRYVTQDLIRRMCGTAVHETRRLVEAGLLRTGTHSDLEPWIGRPLLLNQEVRDFLIELEQVPVPPAQARPSIGLLARKVAAQVEGRPATVVVKYSDPPDFHEFVAALAGVSEIGYLRTESAPPDSAQGFAADLRIRQALRQAGAVWNLGDQAADPRALDAVALLREPLRPIVIGASKEFSNPLPVGVIVTEIPPADSAERSAVWTEEIEKRGLDASPADIAKVSRHFLLPLSSVRQAVQTLPSRGRLQSDALFQSAREASPHGLDTLARRLPRGIGPDALVLPKNTMDRFDELANAILGRFEVYEGWGFSRRKENASVRALLSGPSGCGKTLFATAIGERTGLDVYRVDLASLVSKYIGETEKNLDRVFKAAENANVVLFLDECEALLGKRSEQKDAHDRYANIETAYLLQRMEEFDGVLILATNIRRNIDAAFSRRIHFEIDFPMPDEVSRERLWRQAVPAAAPTQDIDYGFLARQFKNTGGEIANLSLCAAFMARQAGRPIGMEHIVKCLARHGMRQGKIASPGEYRQYFDLIGDARDADGPDTTGRTAEASRSANA